LIHESTVLIFLLFLFLPSLIFLLCISMFSSLSVRSSFTRTTRRCFFNLNLSPPLTRSYFNRSSSLFPLVVSLPRTSRFTTNQRSVHNTAIGVNSSGQKVDRPISPHVTIYSQPIPAISSIVNRTTGVMLYTGLATTATYVLFTQHCDLPVLIHSFSVDHPYVLSVVRGLVAGPLLYHYLAGLRHLYWDYTAKGMDLATVELSSKILIATSIILTIGSMFITLPASTTTTTKQQLQ